MKSKKKKRKERETHTMDNDMSGEKKNGQAKEKVNNTITLHLAASNGHDKTAKVLLEAYPELIDAVDRHGRTALHVAASNGHDKIVKLLISMKPDLMDVVDDEQRTAVHLAVLNGHDKIVKKMWFLLAALGGHDKTLEMLLVAKPELINVVNRRDGRTVWHVAAASGQYTTLELLLKHANSNVINAIDKYGMNVLHMIDVKASSLPFIKMLLPLMSSASINQVSQYAGNVLNNLCRFEYEEIVETILSRMSTQTILAVDFENNMSLLHRAVRCWFVKGAKMLLESHPELINATDIGGNTVLHEAVFYWRHDNPEGFKEMLVLLLAKMGEANLVCTENWEGVTPFQEAIKWCKDDVVELLLPKISLDVLIKVKRSQQHSLVFSQAFNKYCHPFLLLWSNRDVVGKICEYIGYW